MSDAQSFDAYRFSSDLLTKLLAHAADSENGPKTLGYARLLAHEVAAPGEDEQAVVVDILEQLQATAEECLIEWQQRFLADLLTEATDRNTIPPAC